MIQRIDLKVGFQCNNYCKFCVQGDKREKLPAKPLAELLKSLEDGRTSGADGVVFTGGEPTLHPDILALVRKAKALGYKNIQLQSNGRSFCYPGLVARLAAAGADEFGPSLHGSRAEIHDFLTGAPGSFLQTVAGMKNVRKAGARLITNSVVTKANYRDLPDLARLLVSLGVDQYQFAFMHITGRAAQNREWLTGRNTIIEPFVKKGLDVGIKAGRIVMTEAIPYCFMSGYEDHVAEKIIPRTKIYDADAVIEDFTKTRRDEGKAKGPKCPECRYFSACEGPWREYPEMFGWDEFVPVPQTLPQASPTRRRALQGTGRRAAVGAKRQQPRKSGPSKRRGKGLKLFLAGLLASTVVSAWAAEASTRSDELTQLTEEAARNSHQRYMLGLMRYQKGDYAGAKEEWNWALFYDPMNEDAKAGLRRIEGPAAAAVSEQDKRSSQRHYLEGVLYFQKGDYAKAKDEWGLSLSLDRENSDAKAGLERIEELYSTAPEPKDGRVSEEKKASVKLSKEAKKALSNAAAPVTDQARRDSQQHYLSGVIYFQKGDDKKAREKWELALKLDPSNRDAQAGLKRLDEKGQGH